MSANEVQKEICEGEEGRNYKDGKNNMNDVHNLYPS